MLGKRPANHRIYTRSISGRYLWERSVTIPWRSQYVSLKVARGQRIGDPFLTADPTLDLTCLRLVLITVYVQADLSRCLIC